MRSNKYRDSLWDDSEPDYAPCMKRIRGNYIWVCAKPEKDAGYPQKTFTISKTAPEPGTPEYWECAAHARALTRQMLEWFEDEYHGRQPGTWGWLIGRWKADKYSGLNEVDPTTRKEYLNAVNRIENVICDVMIDDTDYEMMMDWRYAMRENGRSASYISKWFTHFGLVNAHGIKIGQEQCIKIKAIRSEMRLGAPSEERADFITRDQYQTMLDQSDAWAEGDPEWRAVSLAMAIRFEFGLRGTDIYGEWQRGTGPIEHRGKVWVKGLEWEKHFDRDLTALTKIPSKTLKKKRTALEFDLTYTPQLRQRLLDMRGDRIGGPVIVKPNGLPPGNGWVQRKFRALVKACGMPATMQIRDLRAGAATEADLLGAEDKGIQRLLGHSSATMTSRYRRQQNEAINRVVQLRQKGGK